MKSFFAITLLISTIAIAAEIKIQESGVGSGATPVSACIASDRDAKLRAADRCNGTLVFQSCSRAPSQFGRDFNCISMCEFTCQY